MKKIISKVFVRITTISLILLSFEKTVFAQWAQTESVPMGGVPSTPSNLDISNLVIVFLLLPFSLLLSIIFYIRYFFMKKKTDDISKIKTKKALKKAKIFLIISILLIILYAIIRTVDDYIMNRL